MIKFWLWDELKIYCNASLNCFHENVKTIFEIETNKSLIDMRISDSQRFRCSILFLRSSYKKNDKLAGKLKAIHILKNTYKANLLKIWTKIADWSNRLGSMAELFFPRLSYRIAASFFVNYDFFYVNSSSLFLTTTCFFNDIRVLELFEVRSQYTHSVSRVYTVITEKPILEIQM